MLFDEPTEPRPTPAAAGEAERWSAGPPAPRPASPVVVPLLSEPPVVLTDPPAIFGGASHTW